MKVFQRQGMSIYSLSGLYATIFNPDEDSAYYEFYIGLLKNDISIITTKVEEPTAKSYSRAKTSGKDWKIEIKQIDSCLVISATNINRIVFREVVDNWGEIKSVALFRDKETTQFSAYAQLPKPLDITSTSPPNSPIFRKEKLTFAMPLLEQEEGETIISTILKGEKSIMIGKTDEYKGCPLDDPKACSEHKSELRCGLARKDKVCKKVARLKGTTRPGMGANIGRIRPKK